MGTNYYARFNKCQECGRRDELHIGKQSCGWRFCFNFIDFQFETGKDWLKFLESLDVDIYNEYDELIDYEYFYEMVQRNQEKKPNTEAIIDRDGYNLMRGIFN